MRSDQSHSSVLDCFVPYSGDSVRQCLLRAAICSRLAKIVSDVPLRRKLYRYKHQNIRACLAQSRGEVEVRADRDRYFGLLSVRLCNGTGVWVHTHQNWINES